ncbi:MAG: PEP-CTERM sorting domain-containing protein [Phycisphaerales bacterium]
MKIAITAIAAIAGAATASPYFASAGGFEATTVGNAGATATITVDISGIQTFDELGSTFNTVLGINIGGGSNVVGIGWDVNQLAGLDSGGASWLSEMTIGFGNTFDGILINLGTSGTDAPGTEANSSGGIVDLTALTTPLDFFVAADGILSLEFFESFVDQAGAAEGEFLANSTLTIQYVPVPAPGALALLGLGGIAAGRRRR